MGQPHAIPPLLTGPELRRQTQGIGQPLDRLRRQSLLDEQLGQCLDRDPRRIGPERDRQRSTQRGGEGVPVVDQIAIASEPGVGDLIRRGGRGRVDAGGALIHY